MITVTSPQIVAELCPDLWRPDGISLPPSLEVFLRVAHGRKLRYRSTMDSGARYYLTIGRRLDKHRVSVQVHRAHYAPTQSIARWNRLWVEVERLTADGIPVYKGLPS